MPGLEGLIPHIIDGLNIIHDVSWELTKGLTIHELIRFYETIQTKEKSGHENEHIQSKNKRILQIITDQCIGEVGDLSPNEKSISFIFTDKLTNQQLEYAFSKIPKIRNILAV